MTLQLHTLQYYAGLYNFSDYQLKKTFQKVLTRPLVNEILLEEEFKDKN